jgi:uncharacterized OB-fold protein
VKAPDGKPAPRFARVKGRLPPTLVRCPGCGQHMFPQAKKCPHCGGNFARLSKKQLKTLEKAEAALATLSRLFENS